MSEWWNAPVHPIWLEIRDERLQNEYNVEHEKLEFNRLKLVATLSWSSYIMLTLRNYRDLGEHNNYLLCFFLTGSLSCSTIFLLAKLVRGRCMKLLTFLHVISRLVTVYIMFYLIDHDEAGVANDRKYMIDAMTLAFVPMTIMFHFYPRVDYFLTIPIAMVSNIVTTLDALTEENGNMDCFKEPQAFIEYHAYQWFAILAIVVAAWYHNKSLDMQLFLQRRQLETQQASLQNILDQQLDGVIILQQAEQPVTDSSDQKQDGEEGSQMESSEQASWSNFSSDWSATLPMQYGAIPSFQNPLESQQGEDCHFEVVFHNNALFKLLQLEENGPSDWTAFLRAPSFDCKGKRAPLLSLYNIARNRYSELIMSQAFAFNGVASQSDKQIGTNASSDKQTLLSFQRTEILFNGKQAVLLNLRAIKENIGIKSSLLKEISTLMPQQITKPLNIANDKLESVKEQCEDQEAAPTPADLAKIKDEITIAQNALKAVEMSNFSLLSVGKIITESFRPSLMTFSSIEMADAVFSLLDFAVRPMIARFELAIEPRLSSIRSDRNLISSVLLNMLESAVSDPKRDSVIRVKFEAIPISEGPISEDEEEPSEKQQTMRNLRPKRSINEFELLFTCQVEYELDEAPTELSPEDLLPHSKQDAQDDQSSKLRRSMNELICERMRGQFESYKHGTSTRTHWASFAAAINDGQLASARYRQTEQQNRLDNVQPSRRLSSNLVNMNENTQTVSSLTDFIFKSFEVKKSSAKLKPPPLEELNQLRTKSTENRKAKHKVDNVMKQYVEGRHESLMKSLFSRQVSKAGKLVVVVDDNKNSVSIYKSLLAQAGYRGNFKACKNTDSAVDFLNLVKSVKDRKPMPADLIIVSYELRKHKIQSILERIVNVGASQIDSQTAVKSLPRVLAKQKVVICSDFDSQAFQSYLRRSKTRGLLKRPLQLQPLIECLKENNVISR